MSDTTLRDWLYFSVLDSICWSLVSSIDIYTDCECPLDFDRSLPFLSSGDSSKFSGSLPVGLREVDGGDFIKF